MKETIRPKYLLLNENKNNYRSFGSLNNKTSYIPRNSSTNDLNSTQVIDYKKIEECKSTIQSIVERITVENKKNCLLKNLIQIMNQEMISIKEESKKSEHQEFFEQSKVIKKLNYDIDKILQKNNEEIANLYRLKDEINAKRSERVVFSNLFRKIETELKNANNLYIETILKSETTKDETLSLKLQDQLNLEYMTMREDMRNKESEEPSEERDIVPKRDEQTHTFTESSHVKKRKFKPEKGGSRFITQHPENYDHSEQIQKKMGFINNKIYQLEFEMKRLFQVTGCSDVEEVEAFVHNVESENEMLERELEKMTKNVEEIIFEQKLIINQRKNAEIVEQTGLPKSRMRLRNVKSLKQIPTETEISQPTLTNRDMVEDLLHIFNLQDDCIDKFESNVSNMDEKLDELLKYVPNENNISEDQERLENETHESSQGSEKHTLPPLNVILDKVEPIGESEKLYEKSWFLDAYQRELKKFNKKENKKK